MMKQSGLLKRRDEREQCIKDTMNRISKQLMLDTLECTLHDFGVGYDRMDRIVKAWSEKFDTYEVALTKDPQADYYRFCLDRELKDLVKNHQEFIPFEKRYPDIKVR